jgi:hypothetical protein
MYVANTTTSPNNKSVAFRGGRSEREMATASGRKNAQGELVEGGLNEAPTPPTRLGKGVRKKAKSAIKRGMISEKAAKKHLKGY